MTDSKVCRICLDEGEENRLFRPCLCDGSQRYVHETCLNRWRHTQGGIAFTICPTCHFHYKLRQIWFAQLLTNEVTLLVLTSLVVSGSIVFIMYFIRFFALLFFGVKVGRGAFMASQQIFGLVMMCLIFLLAIGALLAMLLEKMWIWTSTASFTSCRHLQKWWVLPLQVWEYSCSRRVFTMV